ncbi:MAG: YaiI/YqxD family protein [Gammaproteobacteria bacterium]|nr:YaiI/YqxD family protein [Gammaproteobacteria bacterium]
MQIWVDADACPRVVKDILYRAAERTQTLLTLVANQPLSVPRSPYIVTEQVEKGFDVADHRIVERVHSDDLVITADIPLAADVVAKGATALNPRGELYTEKNIRERLSVRDMMDELRSAGMVSGGPPPLSQRERQAFANQLDRFLARTN